jgi:hypothetical protein
MKRIVEDFKEFIDLAKINQGPDGWTIYSANPRKKKINNRRHRLARLNPTLTQEKKDLD